MNAVSSMLQDKVETFRPKRESPPSPSATQNKQEEMEVTASVEPVSRVHQVISDFRNSQSIVFILVF